MKSKISIGFIGILVLTACVAGEKKKESGFQTACNKGAMTHTTKLTDAEMSAYAIQLPAEIHADVEKNMKDGKLIEAVKIIRGCLDIDLGSTKGITDRIKVKLNL
ncbi:MAG: hypothetical protein KA146_08795 [Leptospiraceae bacterium]|jgi:hypothetical protein|nr:hypothetical protein [Leptospiraceae bacterium]